MNFGGNFLTPLEQFKAVPALRFDSTPVRNDCDTITLFAGISMLATVCERDVAAPRLSLAGKPPLITVEDVSKI
jgi:hypothetical protein